MSPIDFLLISLCMTSAILSVIFWIAWWSFGRPAHALTWCFTFAVMTVQRFLNLGSDWFSDFRVYWVVVDGLAILTASLGLVGHRQRAGRAPAVGTLIAIGFAVELGVAWFTFGRPHVGLQMGLQPLYGGLLVLWMAVILYRFRPVPLLAEVAAAVVHAVFGLLQITAGAVAFLQGAEGDQRFLDLYRMINFLAMPAAFTAMGLFVVFILASDLAERMRELAGNDPLTGLLNRRGFKEAAGRVLAQSQRSRRPLSLILGDIDHFKQVNDTWGHAAGDRALQVFAEQVRRGRRLDDVVARIGGEEFAVLLPNTDAPQAVELAERIRRSLRHVVLEAGGDRIPLRASFGVASRDEATRDVETLVAAADRALYRAKEAGRDGVRLEETTAAAPL